MSGKGSKFGFLKENLQNPTEEPREVAAADEHVALTEAAPPSPAPSVVQPVEPAPKPKTKGQVQASEAPRPVGRPRGKRSDEEHVQVTAYIRRDTHLDVKAALLRDQKGRDFSDLVEELMAKWLKSRT